MREKLFTEEEAYIALLSGDERGLDFLFNRYYSPLLFYSHSITDNQSVSQEIASDAFIKLWKAKDTIGEWRKVRFWLYKVVYHASVDFIRERKTEKRKIKALYLANEITERAILDKLIEVETYNHLHLLLQNLPPRSRQIFQMFYFEKKAIKEIAHELGISVNTVKTQKLRAIQALKKYQGSFYLFTVYSLVFI